MAEKILSSMDSIGNAIVKQLEDTGEHNKTVIKTNVPLGVRKVNETDVLYPEYKDVPDNSTEMWFYESLSNIHFTASAIKGKLTFRFFLFPFHFVTHKILSLCHGKNYYSVFLHYVKV